MWSRAVGVRFPTGCSTCECVTSCASDSISFINPLALLEFTVHHILHIIESRPNNKLQVKSPFLGWNQGVLWSVSNCIRDIAVSMMLRAPSVDDLTTATMEQLRQLLLKSASMVTNI